MKKELPSREYIASLVEYDAETGVVRWKVAKSKNIRVGAAAGSIQNHGYVSLSIDGRRFYAHRIAWLLTYGEWPCRFIDHINGAGTDNRLSNLRLASNGENQMNAKKRRDNTSGVRGVYWDKSNTAWMVSIEANGKKVNAGRFKQKEEATRIANELRERLHGDFANHREAA